MKKFIDASANVYFNQDIFIFTTMSQGMLHYAEPDAPPYYLAPDTDDAALGYTLRLALKGSKHVGVEEFHKILQSGVVQQRHKDRIAWLMKHYGYKTKRALYRKMDNCSIDVIDGNIEISPSHHYALDSYSGISNDGPEILRLPEAATDAELGAALREGFTRCTSVVN